MNLKVLGLEHKKIRTIDRIATEDFATSSSKPVKEKRAASTMSAAYSRKKTTSFIFSLICEFIQ